MGVLRITTAELRELKECYAEALWAWARVEDSLFMVFFEANKGNLRNADYLQATFYTAVSFPRNFVFQEVAV